MALAVLVLAAPALSAPITVDTVGDGFNDDGDCGLREAVVAANTDAQVYATAGECAAGSGADAITIPAGQFMLTDPSGALQVNDDLTLTGAGAAATSITSATSQRILIIGSLTSPDVTVAGLTIDSGHAIAPDQDNTPVTGANGGFGVDGSPATGPAGENGGHGGGIYNSTPGTLTILDCVLSNNKAGDGRPGVAATGGNGGQGGAGAQANGGAGGTGGSGGAVFSFGPVVVRDSTFEANGAGAGGDGGNATGGNGGSGATATSPGRAGGNGIGGAGGAGGDGGAILAAAPVTLERTTFSHNLAGTGGNGGVGNGGFGGLGGGTSGTGGAAGNGSGGNGGITGGGGAAAATELTVTLSEFASNGAGFGRGAGGAGNGGAIAGNGFGTGNGGFGGSGTGGAGGNISDGSALRASGPVDVTASTFADTQTPSGGAGGKGTGKTGGTGGTGGGHGGTGGIGTGGAAAAGPRGTISSTAAVTLVNTTWSVNVNGTGGTGGAAQGGNGGTGSGGGGNGGSALSGGGGNGGTGGVYAAGALTVRNSTFYLSLGGSGGGPGAALGGSPGGASTIGQTGAGGAGALNAAGGGSLTASIVSGVTEPGCIGSIADGGHNLSSSPTCPGAAGDAKLVPLAENGGPTRTIALGDASAAVDALPLGPDCSATDQRGVTRPHGAACDIGAYERAGPDTVTGAADGVDTTAATLRGSVSPNGRATTVRFVYGTTTAYGSVTADQDAGAAVAAGDVAAGVTGLTPGTTYHYRLEGSNSDGSATGDDRTFTTSAPADTGPGANGDTTAPRLVSASMSPATFAVNRRGRRETAVTSVRRGTRLRWNLSEAARIVFAISRAAPGRRAGGRCVKPTRANARRKHCTRYVPAGRFAAAANAGAGSRPFSGRIGRRVLRRGRHRARLVASDAAGNASAAKVLRFRVVRAR